MYPLTLRHEVCIAARQALVFELLTTSEHIVQYFPYQSVESDWQPGDTVLFRGSNDGQVFTDHGVIETLAKPDEFRYRYWSDNHGTENSRENHLTISYKLTTQSDGTLVKLSQHNIKSEEYFQMMNSIWPFLLTELKNYAEKLR